MSTNAFTTSQHQPQTTATRGAQRPSCDTDPEGWTLDRGGLPDWLRAIRTCVTACPLIQQCWETRNRLYAESHPAGVIWAGTAYTETGEPLLTQQRWSSTRTGAAGGRPTHRRRPREQRDLHTVGVVFHRRCVTTGWRFACRRKR